MGALEKPRYRLAADGGWAPVAQSGGLAPESHHAAASYTDPAMAGWYPSGGSADAVLLNELELMRNRANDLDRNNGLIASGKHAFTGNLIGHQLRVNPGPNAEILGWQPEQVDAWSRATRAWFESWANIPSECDAARMLSLRSKATLAAAQWFVNGEALALPIWRPREGCMWNTRIMEVEPHRLNTPDFFQGWNGRRIRGGVEIDADGAPVAYWIRKRHPGDEGLDTVDQAGLLKAYRRIPAFYPWGRRRVIHLFDKERPGQNRGKTVVATIMRELAMADKYPRVELQATIANSLVAAIIESNLPPDAVVELFKSVSATDPVSAWQDSVLNMKNQAKLMPGATLALPIGAKFTGFAPSRPNAVFDKFMESVFRMIAAGLGMPYEVLTKDFTKTNYSSARAALLEGWRWFLDRRALLEEMWLNPVYELWLEEAVDTGRVPAPGFYDLRFAYQQTKRWTMAGRGWIDPKKEAEAAEVRMNARISNLAIECADQGTDWRENIDQLAEIERYAKEKGVELAPKQAAPAQQQNPKADDEDEAEDEERMAA